MRTFIVEWNPSSSRLSNRQFLEMGCNLDWGNYSFLFRNIIEARSGDNFYLVRTGTRNNGIVCYGFFLSNPYSPSAEGFACRIDFRPTFLVPWETPRGIVSLSELNDALPLLQWKGYDACHCLSQSETDILSDIWEKYVRGFSEEDYDDGEAARTLRPEGGIEDAIEAAIDALYDRKDREGNPLILQALELANSWNTLRYKTIAFLFYASRYSGLDPGRVRGKGFPEDYADTVSALKRNPGMGTGDFIRHLILQNNTRASKIAVRDMELHPGDWPLEETEESADLIDALYESAGIEMEG